MHAPMVDLFLRMLIQKHYTQKKNLQQHAISEVDKVLCVSGFEHA